MKPRNQKWQSELLFNFSMARGQGVLLVFACWCYSTAVPITIRQHGLTVLAPLAPRGAPHRRETVPCSAHAGSSCVGSWRRTQSFWSTSRSSDESRDGKMQRSGRRATSGAADLLTHCGDGRGHAPTAVRSAGTIVGVRRWASRSSAGSSSRPSDVAVGTAILVAISIEPRISNSSSVRR